MKPNPFFFFVAAAMFFSASASAAPDVQKTEYTCGAVLPLSGTVAEWGTVMKNAMETARTDFNAGSVRFLYEDDQYVPKNTVSAVQKLLAVDNVDCLITLGSSTSMSAQTLAERAGVPLFAVALNPKVGQGMHFVFRYYVPINRQVEAILRELPRRNYQRIAFVSSTHDATLALRDALLSANAVVPAADEEIFAGEADISAVALKVLKKKPDAVFLNTVPPQPSTLARKLRELGYQGQFFSGPLLESQEEISNSNGALEGAWFVTVDNANADAFNTKYEKRFGSKPVILAIYAYDIAKIIIQGHRMNKLGDYIRSLESFEGLAGRYGWDGAGFDIPAAVWEIRGGAFKRKH